MGPSRQPLQQLRQGNRSANLSDPKSSIKIKPDPLAPKNQDNKVHKPLPTKKPVPRIDPLEVQLRHGYRGLAEIPKILPQGVLSQRWEDKHKSDKEKTKGNIDFWTWPRFNLNDGFCLLTERQQKINEWKASGLLSAFNAALPRMFERRQPQTARQVWLAVQEERRWIEADIKLWNDGPMPLTCEDQHERDRLNEQMDRVEMAERYVYGVYKEIIAPLVESERLAKEKEQRDKVEMDRLVEDAYQSILSTETQTTDIKSE